MREVLVHDTRSGRCCSRYSRATPGRVGVYACGPTVYSRIHIGNARPFVVFSLLKRFLEHEGYGVKLVVNVTDVNDKIYDAAHAPDRPSAELAAEMTELYRADTDALGLGRPDHEPLASETIGPIVEHIAALVDGGPRLRGRRRRVLPRALGRRLRQPLAPPPRRHGPGRGRRGRRAQGGPARLRAVEGAQAGEDTVWDSPWGAGRPGWHIECSAMAEQLLGVGFDIHGGGSDLVFPHHENEAAQTRARRGSELAKLWMHNGMIQFTGEKMAKSVGNIALLARGDRAVRLRAPSSCTCSPGTTASRWPSRRPSCRPIAACSACAMRCGASTPAAPSPPDMAHHKEAFFDALANDFNTPTALAALFEWVREANRRGAGVGDADLREMLGVLGLGELTPLQARGDVATIEPRPPALLEQARASATERGRRRPTRSASSCGRCAGRSATGRRPGADPRRQTVILYGRNPVYEALRGRRAPAT